MCLPTPRAQLWPQLGQRLALLQDLNTWTFRRMRGTGHCKTSLLSSVLQTCTHCLLEISVDAAA